MTQFKQIMSTLHYTQYGPITNSGGTAHPDTTFHYRTISRGYWAKPFPNLNELIYKGTIDPLHHIPRGQSPPGPHSNEGPAYAPRTLRTLSKAILVQIPSKVPNPSDLSLNLSLFLSHLFKS